MASFRRRLEARAGEQNHKREFLKKCKTVKKILDGRIKLTIQELDEHNLLGVSKVGEYIVFDAFRHIYNNHLADQFAMEHRNKIDMYVLNHSINFKEVDKGVDEKNKTINVYYLYKLIKGIVKPIGDLEPICDDDNCTIKYEWEVSSKNHPKKKEVPQDDFMEDALMY